MPNLLALFLDKMTVFPLFPFSHRGVSHIHTSIHNNSLIMIEKEEGKVSK
jgi:hypothetical protein